MSESGTFKGEVQRGWARFWALRWRWKATILALLALLLIGAIGSAGGADEKDGATKATVDAASTTKTANTPKPTGEAQPTVAASTSIKIPPTPIPSTATPAPPPPLAEQMERSIRDNKNAVNSGASLDGLVVTFDDSTGSLIASISPKAPNTLPGFLTNGSALAVIVGRAVWSTYPDVLQVDLYVKRSGTDPSGASRQEFATFARYSRAVGEQFTYDRLRTQPADDNKRMFCDADVYDIALDIFEALKDKGCLLRFAGTRGAAAFVAGPVFSQLPAVGRPVLLKDDGWILTVTRVTKVTSVTDGFQKKNALGIYLVAEVAMENVSNKAQSLCGDRFSVVDDRGRKFDFYLDGTSTYGQKELCSRINAGLKAPAVLLFDLPPDATGLVFKSLGGFRVALGNLVDIH